MRRVASDRSKETNADKNIITSVKYDDKVYKENKPVQALKDCTNDLSNTTYHDYNDLLCISSVIDNLLSDRLESAMKRLEDSVDIPL